MLEKGLCTALRVEMRCVENNHLHKHWRSVDYFVTQVGQKEEQVGVGQVTFSLRRAGEGVEL